jgi:hypothetical protein
VWKVQRRGALPAIYVQPATRGAARTETSVDGFLRVVAESARFFGGVGGFALQPFADRLAEGMVRCYLTGDRVVGFGHQMVTALTEPPPGAPGPPDPEPRTYHGPTHADFHALREALEGGWVDLMTRMLDISVGQLPVIWDADFLLGPKNGAGEDTYQLCEINVSGVFPIPAEAIPQLVEATIRRLK